MSELTPVNKLIPLEGEWAIDAQSIYLRPREGAAWPMGLCVSDAEMNEGAVEVHVALDSVDPDHDSAGRILLGFRSSDERYLSVGIGGYNAAFVLAEFVLPIGWRALCLAGSRNNLTKGQLYRLEVRLHGQRLTLRVDGVRVLEAVIEQPLLKGQVGLFSWGTAQVAFNSLRVAKYPGAAFVVMEFGEPYHQLFKQVIQPTAKRYDLEAYHAGEVFGPGLILQDIVSGIVNAQVVIAEITPVNQNVFYELGYAHALGKPTILLAERGKRLPFDVSGYRCVFYDNTIAGKADVEAALSNHLKAIFGEPRGAA